MLYKLEPEAHQLIMGCIEIIAVGAKHVPLSRKVRCRLQQMLRPYDWHRMTMMSIDYIR